MVANKAWLCGCYVQGVVVNKVLLLQGVVANKVLLLQGVVANKVLLLVVTLQECEVGPLNKSNCHQ